MSNVLVKIHTKKPAQNEIKILFCMQVSMHCRRSKNALYNERKYVKFSIHLVCYNGGTVLYSKKFPILSRIVYLSRYIYFFENPIIFEHSKIFFGLVYLYLSSTPNFIKEEWTMFAKVFTLYSLL